MMRVRPWLRLLPMLFVPLAAAAPPAATPLQGIDAYVQQVMRDWRVPGLALAVVKDGNVVMARGYGVRELGKAGPVDADTLFGIGSNSKAFTAAALGNLVAAGKLTWDTPVFDALTSFRVDNAYVTQAMTLRDLLTHRSGYCDPTLAWYTSDASDILKRIRYQKPTFGFRAAFCYNNVQYLAAGRFIHALTGQHWNAYLTAHLFRPLGMTRTVGTEEGVAAAANVAAPHGMVGGKPIAIHRYWPHNMDIFAAAGGIWSSATDMSHWLQMLLADGQYAGNRVLAASTIRAMETPQVLIQRGGVGDEIRAWMPGGHFYTYGLGLFVQDDQGHNLVWHAGDIDGMASAVALVPDAGIGVVVLSNMNGNNARFAIIARILQSMLNQPRHDLEPALLADAAKARAEQAAAEKTFASTRVPDAKPLLMPTAYTGTYADNLDGTAKVALEQGHLVLRLGNPGFTGDLQPWHDSTFRVTWRYRFRGDDYATFDVDALGRPARLELANLQLRFQRESNPERQPR